MTLELALVAAEASGDLLGAHLLQALRLRWPELRAAGIGGEHLAGAGFEAWWPIEQLSVRGYLEVLPRLPALLRLRRALVARLLQQRPSLFVGVDAPDFNFAVETRLKAAGIKTLHFVSPSFWAWRPHRLRVLQAAADHVLCLFPFEPALLAAAGIAATYVGHPLAQTIAAEPDQAAARRALELPEDATVVALLPGSRNAEVGHLAPRFLQAAAHLHARQSDLWFVLPAVPWLHDRIRQMARQPGVATLAQRLVVVRGQSHAALAACDLALVASGTATLEAALFKRPMVIAYAMPQLSYRFMRRKRQLPWVGLPNVLCAPTEWLQPLPPAAARARADRRDAPLVVPELIQDAATPAALAAALQAWLDAPGRMAAVRQRFAALHQTLRQPTATLAADAIENLLQN
ncbi:MAG: lipid-A-disaccharide synthase [Ottowia sp.]|nr:lipid-A-disaccharide synthase [Ottowia sp.]